MIVQCEICKRRFDDEFRLTYCPHDTFAANDGENNFAHRENSYLEPQSDLDRVLEDSTRNVNDSVDEEFMSGKYEGFETSLDTD